MKVNNRRKHYSQLATIKHWGFSDIVFGYYLLNDNLGATLYSRCFELFHQADHIDQSEQDNTPAKERIQSIEHPARIEWDGRYSIRECYNIEIRTRNNFHYSVRPILQREIRHIQKQILPTRLLPQQSLTNIILVLSQSVMLNVLKSPLSNCIMDVYKSFTNSYVEEFQSDSSETEIDIIIDNTLSPCHNGTYYPQVDLYQEILTTI